MRFQQAAMALAMQGFFPGAEAGIMFKRTGQLGGLEGPGGSPVGAVKPVGPGGPGGPGGVRGPGGPGGIRPPPPPPAGTDVLTPPGVELPEATPITDANELPILVTETPVDIITTSIEVLEPPVETPEVGVPPVLIEDPIETPPAPPAPPTVTPVETPEVVIPPVLIETPVETPIETPEAVIPPVLIETPIETPEIVETPIETPEIVETPTEIIEPPVETPLETPEVVVPPVLVETPIEVTQEVTVTVTQDDGVVETVTQTLDGETIIGGEVTVTVTQGNGEVETVTQTLPGATVTAIIAQPIIIIVEQTTNFNFDFSLGGVCPPVVADPAGSGGFVVGEDAMLPTLPQACRAACQIQFEQCSAKAGENFQVADCQKQLDACNAAAATETLIEAPAQTVTKTVFLPPTEVPGIEAELSSDGCVIITTETLPADEVATIGDEGISVITTTVGAEATAAAPELVETTMVVTLEAPPAGGIGAPQPSVVTMTMTVPAAPKPSAGGPPPPPAEHSVVTVTVGDSTGVVTLPAPVATEAGKPGKPGNNGPIEDSDEKPVVGEESENNGPPPPPAGTDAAAPPPPPAGTDAVPPPKPTGGPAGPGGERPGRPGRPGAGGPGPAEECPPCLGQGGVCPDAVTVTVTEAAVTVTVTKGDDGAAETLAPENTETLTIVEPTPEATPPALETPPVLETPLLPTDGTTLTTKIGTSPTEAPVEIPDQLSVDEEERPAPGKGLFSGLFGN